jgi:hypothetical protein
LSRGEIEAESTEISKRYGIIVRCMAEGEGGYKPPEADVNPPSEKKGSFRDAFRYIVKNWPPSVALHRKMEERYERIRWEREQRRDPPPKNSTS